MGYIKTLLLALALCFAFGQQAAAQQGPEISELSVLDRQFMSSQRELLEDISRQHLGFGFSGEKERDLRTLQILLDRELVRNSQTQELQAMGVVLGDLLAAELGMHWVVYEDKLGRSRALRFRDSDTYLFPMTMISRRREVDNTTAVVDIYNKAYAIIDALREPPPFQ